MRLALVFAIAALSAACSHESVQREPSSDMHHHMKGMAAPSCTNWVDKVTPEQQTVINNVMATREHRLHHALWHAVRGGMSASDQKTLEAKFGDSWAKANPLCPTPQDNFLSSTYNPAGEDFLFMHHEMIGMLRTELIAANLPCISGWTHVPTPAEWALPDKVTSGPKSPQTLRLLQTWDQKFRDPVWLKAHSLSQVGWALEYSVHNNLHMRYATDKAPKGFDQDGAPINLDGSYPANWTYDDPKYNWLADPYGAAVNPTFWKIHGYVDSIVDAWLKANDFDTIATDCMGAARCYQWKGQWTGELTLPKATRDFPTLGDARPDPAAGKRLAKRRMDIQRMGVLKDSDFAPRAPAPNDSVNQSKAPRAPRAEGPSDDPFEYTQASLCSQS